MDVSVIIPTTCEEARRASLLRAIKSVLSQAEVRTDLLVVVNGDRYSADLLQELRHDGTLRVVQHDVGNISIARQRGIAQAEQSYFAFLDDDDVLLPRSLVTRLQELRGHELDLVVGNGYDASGRLLFKDIAALRADPLASLLEYNWLTSCGGLFRKSTVGPQFFERDLRYHEWTWLAFRCLHGGLKIGFVEEPTFRLYDTSGSASKMRSADSIQAGLSLLEVMLQSIRRADLRNLLRRRMAA